jgi:hypothetical protein
MPHGGSGTGCGFRILVVYYETIKRELNKRLAGDCNT